MKPNAERAVGGAPGEAGIYAPERDQNRKPIPQKSRSIDQAVNGSMVQDLDDAKRLGRDMQRMKTGSELSEEGLISDPIQH